MRGVIWANARLAPPVVALSAIVAAVLPASAGAAPVPTTVQAVQQVVAASVAPEPPAPIAQEAAEQISTAPARTTPAAAVPRRLVQRAPHAPKHIVRRAVKETITAPASAAVIHHALRASIAKPVSRVPAPDDSRAHGPMPRAPHLPPVLDRLATGMTVLPSFPARAFVAHRADRMVARGFAVVGQGGGASSAAQPARLGSTPSDSAPTDSPDLVATSKALPSPGAVAGGVLALLVVLWLVVPGFHAPRARMPTARLLALPFALELPG
jgi:hypothetical protein